MTCPYVDHQCGEHAQCVKCEKGAETMTMINSKGEKVYYNNVVKHGKWCFVIQAASGQAILGRDKQKRKTRTFAQEHQAESWLRRNGYVAI